MSRQWKIGSRLIRIAGAALIASASLVAAPLLPSDHSQAFAQAPPQAQQQPQPQGVADDVRAVLSQYGNFVQHQLYGEVWIPSVTPQGWHPYPACHWVNTKQFGWYYDDKTPWGAIVHHYGRWTHDDQVGWFWVPGAEFSPGWVVWRTSLQWVGWAPMPPDEDIQHASPDQFNNADFWIFMETAKFANNCNEVTVVAGPQSLVLVQQTTFVREIEIIGGIIVFVLPPYVVGPIVVIDVDFAPWPAWFFGQILIDWNWVWNNVNIVININNPNCPPNVEPAIKQPPKPVSLPLPPPPLPTPPAKCPDGSFANAYGLCRTATNPCSQGMVARGNFCFPLTNPTCGPGTTPTATAGGGVLCLPPRIACGRGTHLADGKCVSDPQPCGSGEMRNSAGQCVKNIAVPICGAGAVNVGGRCAPVDQHTTPTITIKDPGLRHPSVPITPRTPTVKVSNNFPTKLVTPVATNNPKPPYVIGRGGHGLNLYNSGQGSTPSNRNSKSTVPFRTGGQPILHGLPAMGMSKSQGQTIR